MFTISYSAAYDPYHTVFRFICALTSSSSNQIEYKKLRIVDFFVCFPWLLSEVKASRSVPGFLKSRNALVQRYPKNPYDVLPNSRSLFERMEPIHLAACSALISEGIADGLQPQFRDLKLTGGKIDEKLATSVNRFLDEKGDLVSFLVNELTLLSYSGVGGLKDRTNLAEYRYDDV